MLGKPVLKGGRKSSYSTLVVLKYGKDSLVAYRKYPRIAHPNLRI